MIDSDAKEIFWYGPEAEFFKLLFEQKNRDQWHLIEIGDNTLWNINSRFFCWIEMNITPSTYWSNFFSNFFSPYIYTNSQYPKF
jgi:hypothetical protein